MGPAAHILARDNNQHQLCSTWGQQHHSTMSHNVSLNVLCFPFTIGKVKITIFHLLVACTFVFTYLWGYIIYTTLVKDNREETKIVGERESLLANNHQPAPGE